MREVSLYGSGGKPDWFWELNPAGTVPIVVTVTSSSSSVTAEVDDDGKEGWEEVFADSELILDAIGNGRIVASDTIDTIDTNEDKEGALLLAGKMSEEENARVDRWRSAISDKLVPVGKSAVLGGSSSKLRSLLKEMNELVDEDGPYLVGNRVTLADCAAFPFLWRIDREFGIGGTEKENDEGKLRAWLDACVNTASMKRTIPVRGWWWWW